ncbi:VOC family protein [Vibrio kasasachensis]|uniref:VOC family protein n=1 Tax=Vibrio kasasachensis TaxID=2910248 RepID=UPI003D0F9094
MILNHISLGVSDVVAATKFYDDVLGALDIHRSHTIENIASAYGERFEFWIGCPCEKRSSAGNGTHVAFNAASQKAVADFHTKALALGGTCEGKPGMRPEYGEGYYAAYIRDKDGNKLEAVFMG